MSAKIISFGNMKGGVGKSTLTSMIGNYIHRVEGKKILVVDCDDLQRTITTIRKEEEHKNKNVYEILESNSEDVLDLIPNLVESYDYIFIDLPGNLKQKGVVESYMMMDYIIIPTSLTDDDLDSTYKFLNIILDKIIPAREAIGEQTKLFGLLYKESKKSKEYIQFLKEKDDAPIVFFDTVIPNSRVLVRSTSTTKQNNYHSKTFKIKEFYKEFIKRIN